MGMGDTRLKSVLPPLDLSSAACGGNERRDSSRKEKKMGGAIGVVGIRHGRGGRDGRAPLMQQNADSLVSSRSPDKRGALMRWWASGRMGAGARKNRRLGEKV